VKKLKWNAHQPRGSTHPSKNQTDILDVNEADKGDAVIVEDCD
jgi:hypothetical protein